MPSETIAQELPRSVFRCPECGSFFDEPRLHPLTGDLARKCVACLDWYPLVGLGWEGSRERGPSGPPSLGHDGPCRS
jgi:hypothetical protein